MSAARRRIWPASAGRIAARGGGFTLLELVVCIAVFMALAGVLLSRLQYYQEAAERADMEYTANTLKLALQLRIARDLGQQRPVNYAAVMSENPASWLEQPMKNYRGEVGQAEAALLPRGSWYFDRERRELAYRPLRDRHLAPDSEGRKEVRFQVHAVRAQAGERKDDAAAVGLQFSPAEPYRWP
jgi:type II secretory pathway pseudopilin PulG